MFAALLCITATFQSAVQVRIPLAFDDASTRSDEAVLRKAGLGTDVVALLDFFRRRTLTEEDLIRLNALVGQLGSNAYDTREHASLELAAAGRRALPFLRRAMKDADLEVVRRAADCLRQIERRNEQPVVLAALNLLGERRPGGCVEVLLNYLPFTDDAIVEEEILTVLNGLATTGSRPEPALVAAVHSGIPLARAAAGRVLGRSSAPERREIARTLLKDPDARVRLWTAHGFLAAKDRDALPVLIELLWDAQQDLAWQAQDLLCCVAEEHAPLVSLGTGTAAERRKCRDAWADWWETIGSKLDPAHLDLESKSSGTLIVSYTGYSGNRGRVWERAKDGAVRWKINDIHGPIDAQSLPGGRVLIAEYGGQRVTERDRQGQVLWEYKWPERQPLGCQRLPNGNTVIACINEIREITPDGKASTLLTQRGSTILSFQKLRNGHLVFLTYDGVIREINEQGNELRSFRVERPNEGLVSVEALPGGHLLVPLTSSGRIAEYDMSEQEVRSWPMERPTAATRLPNGNLLACSNKDQRIVEMTPAGKIVWEDRAEGRIFRVRPR